MMPEREPPIAGGVPAGRSRLGAPGNGSTDHGSTDPGSTDPGSTDPDRDPSQGTAVDSEAVGDDATVVDLRSPATRERRSPEVRTPEARTIATPPLDDVTDDSLPVAPPTSSLASRVVRLAAPALVVLVAASVLAGVATLRAIDGQRDASTWSDLASIQADRAAALDAVRISTLAVVVGGYAEQLPVADELDELLGALSEGPGPATPDGRADAEMELATQARRAFAEDVRDTVERTGGRPVDLGDELPQLDESHAAAAAATRDARERLGAAADAASDRADAAAALALLVLVLGVVGALVAAELTRRRLRSGLDLPMAALVDEVAVLGSGRPPAERDERAVSHGFPELAWVLTELRTRMGSERALLGRLRRRAEWGEQRRRILEGLDLAEDERATHEVLQRALATVAAGHAGELLLAERGSSTLQRVAVNPHLDPPGCGVASTSACIALRRGQVAVFDSSEAINACPYLRDRPSGACSAACVPVTVSARPVGVVHVTGVDQQPPSAELVDQLVGLATHAGTRLAALRALESSRQEASTDGLTGLPNRRSFEAQVVELFDRETPFVTVLADLDRFKLLNDNYGHETGDKALQLFAAVLRDNVRGNDLVARLGGEEFVLVYPDMTVEISLEAIDRVRAALARALQSSTVPPFTCSFGIAHSSVGHDGESVLRVADAGMLRAKDLGGDQAVVADAELAATIFAEDAPLRSRRDRT